MMGLQYRVPLMHNKLLYAYLAFNTLRFSVALMDKDNENRLDTYTSDSKCLNGIDQTTQPMLLATRVLLNRNNANQREKLACLSC